MSEVKVNKISPRTNCGTVTVGDSGDSVSVTAGVPVTVNGDLKSNALKATDGGSIISQCGTNITLGASGDTINLAAGASQSGFGRTGTVDWDTTPKTATFTAVSGEGYFVNTTSGAITVTLPAGSAGSIVSLKDYANTWDTNSVTVTPNGTDKINGNNASATLNTEDQSVTLVYVDSTKGWRAVQDSTSSVTGANNIVATGGTITECGNCKIHTFTGPGTFCVSQISTTVADNTISYLVIAGGGAGGSRHGGGGGAGGFREVKSPTTPYTASPLDGYPSAPNRITITASPYPISVGGGGPAPGEASGSNSVFSTITSAGGGAGRQSQAGLNGGSGGGGAGPTAGTAGSGNTPPVSPPQGNPGGVGGPGPAGEYNGGGGGGSAQTGGAPGPTHAGGGGDGSSTSITGSSVQRAGGGGGGSFAPQGNPRGNGGAGNGGGGRGGSGSPAVIAQSGTANTGGGGGGQGGNDCLPTHPCAAGNGGSGIVVIRYKFQ
jgi:hypothetical protein